jgi:hypothetical protein
VVHRYGLAALNLLQLYGLLEGLFR